MYVEVCAHTTVQSLNHLRLEEKAPFPFGIFKWLVGGKATAPNFKALQFANTLKKNSSAKIA